MTTLKITIDMKKETKSHPKALACRLSVTAPEKAIMAATNQENMTEAQVDEMIER